MLDVTPSKLQLTIELHIGAVVAMIHVNKGFIMLLLTDSCCIFHPTLQEVEASGDFEGQCICNINL